MRHAVAGRLGVSLDRASLWLLLACDLLPEAVVCVVFCCVFGSEKCVSVYFVENISRVCFVLPSCCILMVFVVENPTAATSSLFSDFLLRLCKASPVLQPKGGEHY